MRPDRAARTGSSAPAPGPERTSGHYSDVVAAPVVQRVLQQILTELSAAGHCVDAFADPTIGDMLGEPVTAE